MAAAAEFPPGSSKIVREGALFVGVYNCGGELYAIEDLCTHDGNPLADGPVEGLEVVCPRHGARFCLRTGAALAPPAYEAVRTFAVERRDGRLRVALR